MTNTKFKEEREKIKTKEGAADDSHPLKHHTPRPIWKAAS
jgi:hypothetical protein